MCCLKYENDHYEEASAVARRRCFSTTPDGSGKVIGLNILDISMQVK